MLGSKRRRDLGKTIAMAEVFTSTVVKQAITEQLFILLH
jgi:hypothetical protein